MLDTIPHIIDSTRQIINIVMPEKSFIEVYTPLIGLVLTLIAIVVSSYWNIRQLKNSHILLEKNTEANLKTSLLNTKISNELKLVDEFREIRDKIIEKMNAVSIYRFSIDTEKREGLISEILNLSSLSKNKLKRLTIGESLDYDISVTQFTSLIASDEKANDFIKEFEKIKAQQNKFISISSKIIEKEKETIYKMNN